MTTSEFVGINIQWPISNLIIEGKKTIETRKYPIPPKYVNQPLAMIETPGPKGNFKARIVGLITFGESFEYHSKKDFYEDKLAHCVNRHSEWAWNDSAKRFGWPIVALRTFESPVMAPQKKGIKYTTGIQLNYDASLT